jgi:CheY-like chemotaxis protein
VSGGGLWQIEADPNELEGAILNLAVNARDAMRDGGKLRLETSNTYLDEDYCRHNDDIQPGQYVMIAVTDTGTGMSPEVLNRAIEPFFTTKTPEAGTGLGLSQVYGFIKQSGGHFKLSSEVGKGTTAKIYFPRLIGAPTEADAPPSELVGGHSGEALLVVEDDPDVRAYVVEVLRDLGYRILEAQDAEAALQLMAQPDVRVDLLLTDVILPGMNGRQLADELKKRQPGLKTLFMTGYSRDAIVHEGRLAPGVELMQKPLTQLLLATRIRAVLDAT